jgi:membrane protein implicated in regulation of membrane protease activity
MSAELIWVIAAGALAVGELLTGGLVLLMFALAAVAGGLTALLGAGPTWQVLAFVVASGGFTLGLRPIAKRHIMQPPAIATGTDALVGASALVTEEVDGEDGRVKIRGEVWSARSFPEGSVLEVGSTVRVLRIDGATAVVHRHVI